MRIIDHVDIDRTYSMTEWVVGIVVFLGVIYVLLRLAWGFFWGSEDAD